MFHKRFWLSVAHLAIMGAGTAGAILVPGAAPLIMLGVSATNALLPSPLSPVAPPASTPPPKA